MSDKPEIEHDEQGRVKLSSIRTDTAVNILCHQDDVEIVNDRDDVLEITPESTLAMAAKFKDSTWAMAKQDADFKRRLAIVYPDWDIETDPRHLRDCPIGYRHVVGLIVCTNMAINTGRIPFWRTPEAYLHPSTQSRLVNLMALYTKDAEQAAASQEPQ